MNIIQNYPLASRVLVVAVLGEKNDWAAYIDAVQGINHNREQQEVAQNGDKLPYELAKIIFPEIASKYQWRD